MPRLPRICPPGIPQHLIQRGHNKNICFAANIDYATYSNYLKDASERYNVDIHAWVFMTNHIHLLVTPQCSEGISKMMQTLGRKYVGFYNKSYERSGTLWDGRFKSCLVQTTEYLIQCYRYIELNPVRAHMVDDPADYHWSSYQHNALDKKSSFICEHPIYSSLGGSKKERQYNYRELFKTQIDNTFIKEVRIATNTNMALGNKRFKDEIEEMYSRRVRPATIGRPRKKQGGSDTSLLR